MVGFQPSAFVKAMEEHKVRWRSYVVSLKGVVVVVAAAAAGGASPDGGCIAPNGLVSPLKFPF